MLVTMTEMLQRASKENYGIVAPNTYNENDARAFIAAAEELNSPIILDVGAGQTTDIELAGGYMSKLADQTPIPVAVNLDHGGSVSKSFETVATEIMAAIKGGYSSVMVDRSYLPFEENIKETAILTKMAHALGLSVESELGHVGSGTEYIKDGSSAFTDPSVAKEFVERTGVDCLAIAVGTAHGVYEKTPTLEFDLIKEIKKTLNGLPLVLHGGSNSGHDNLHKACQIGINKVNIGFEIYKHVSERIQAQDFSGLKAYNFYSYIQEAEMEKVSELIECFGSKGKAWKYEKTFKPAEEYLLGKVGDDFV